VIRDPAPLWCLLLASLRRLGACGDAGTDEGATAAPDLAGLDATVHLLTFSRLQGYAEGVPCDPDGEQPLASAAALRQRLRERGDGVVLACVGDSLQHSAYVLRSRPARESAFARGRVVLEAMGAAGVDVYVPSHGDFDGGVQRLFDDAAAAGLDIVLSNVVSDSREITPYKVVEHDGLRIALLGLIAPESAAEADYEDLRVLKPAKRVKALCERIGEAGEANLIVAFSNLPGKANQTLCDAVPQLHFIVGSSDTGFKADRAVRRGSFPPAPGRALPAGGGGPAASADEPAARGPQ